MSEIWKDIKGANGVYQVSSLGRVKSKRGNEKILKLNPRGRGYLSVKVKIRGRYKAHYVHRLVSAEFLDNPNNFKEVNHKDGDKKNNSVYNLEWCTRSFNTLHAFKMGLKHPGTKRKLDKYQILNILKLIENKINYQSIADKFKVSKACIWRIDKGITYRSITNKKHPKHNQL